MGAIAAVFSPGRHVEAAVPRRMLAASPHRGAEAHVVSYGDTVLGIAIRPDDRDAWVAQRGPLLVGFVGTLDNAEELIKLYNIGVSFSARAHPADLVAALYLALGDSTPEVLRGAFACIVTDGTRFVAFRDHLGLGTLFYREDAQGLFVATEAKQVAIGAGISLQPDLEVLERMFYNLSSGDALSCALKGVHRLPKASILRAIPGKPTVVARYWAPERLLETARLSLDDIRARFEELMDRAVTRAMAGTPVLSLSGGIDSTAVAAFAAPAHLRLTGRPLPAITQVFPDHPTVDERRYTEMVADYLGITLHTYTSAVGHLDDLDHWVRLVDGPPLALLPEIAYQQRLVRRLGFRTVLTGEFGEFVYDMRTALVTHLAAKKRYAALWRIFRTWPADGMLRAQLARDVLAAFVPLPLAVAYRRLVRRRGNPMLPDWIDRRLGSRAFYHHHLNTPPGRLWSEAQLVAFTEPSIGMESLEICGAFHGVRTRQPLADVDLWEFFLSLPAEVKYPERLSKALVRSLLRGRLPDAVLARRDKTVFDEFAVAKTDYTALRRWLLNGSYRMPGVDYARLQAQLDRQDFALRDVVWANDLAAIHAFVSLW
ncbi:MAG: asparagine synthase-related protein [Armatimonadota bacterium]|nr:asparagine synthase-related protein [Armatimonadota bacterium]